MTNTMNVMLPAAGSLTDFFTAISTLAHEYQAAGNAVLIGIALLILGSKFLIGDDESKARGRFQCPHGLELLRLEPIQRAYSKASFNALSGLYLISTVPLQKPRFYAVSRACFCRYLSEYSDNSRFSCMLTFWTYLMRCTYP